MFLSNFLRASGNDAPCGPIPSPPRGWASWGLLMDKAIELARRGAKANEVPVGALVVDRNGAIIGAAHNQPQSNLDPTAHAEILALRAAASHAGNYRLDGTTLIVTLEPCLMCAGAIIHARIAGVVYGAYDAQAGAVTSCMEGFALPFANHHPWHMGGVQQQACSELLNTFFEARR